MTLLLETSEVSVGAPAPLRADRFIAYTSPGNTAAISFMRKLRHPRALIFGLLLLIAQALAAAHAIGHGVGVEQGDPATPACEWCAAFGQLGAALPGSAAPAASPSAPLHCGVYVARFFVPPLRLAFRAQAPPLPS